MSTTPKAGLKLSFQSKIENWAERMDYCAIPVPARITKALGTKSAVLVTARVNDSAPFKVSLFPAGGGKHYIRLRAKVRKAAGLKEGDLVKVHVTVLDRADITIPKDLASALRTENITADFNALTPGKKNYIIRRIDDALKPETREARSRRRRRNPPRPRKKARPRVDSRDRWRPHSELKFGERSPRPPKTKGRDAPAFRIRLLVSST